MRRILIPSILCGLLLAGCGAKETRPVSYGDDALPSAEVTAFQTTDARLRYRNASIAYDGQSCAVYEGIGPGGAVMRVPLADAGGQPICRAP
ncbi:MAG: hypothetical protein PGN09_03585 [Sphingomonas fennica]